MPEPDLTLLVVDDDDYILELLKAFFEQSGVRVFTAASAEAALALGNLDQVHVALLDIKLPVVNGHDLQRELNRRFPDMAKILMSGQADLDDVIAAFSDQAFSFVQKPFSSLKEIAVLVRRAAESKRLVIENREYARRLAESNKSLTEDASRYASERQFRHILSHLYFESRKIARAETPADLLEFLCQMLVEAGSCERAAIVAGDEKFFVQYVGAWEGEGPGERFRESLNAFVGQPLRPYDFDRSEERIGSAVYAQPAERTMGQVFVPLHKLDGRILGYLTVASAAEPAPPSPELVQLLEIVLIHGSQQLDAQSLRDELRERAEKSDSLVSEVMAELRLVEERFARLMDASTDIVYITDASERLTLLNESFTRSLGYVRENYLGRTLRHMLEELATENPINRRAIEDLTAQPLDQGIHHVEVLTREGDKRMLEIKRTIFRKGDAVVGTQGVVRDISGHRALLQQLVASERLATTGRIAAGVAHEIKNPLQAMISQIKSVQEKIAARQDTSENLAMFEESLERLRYIIGSMLDLNRTSTAARLPVNMNSLVEKVLALLQQQLRSHSIQVRMDLAADLPFVAGSSQELQQVLLNLVLNAIEAMPGGGDLAIRTASVGNRVEASIEDSGVGMSPDQMKQIFEPFFTVRLSGTGTGLGLYVSKGIVEMHQGTIAVDSQPSQGARFTISLPRA